MLHLLKVSGKKTAYDSTSGAFIRLSSLEYKMMGALTPPLPQICPTSLRYELAKFDSESVSEAYDRLKDLYDRNLIFARPENGEIKLITSGEFAAESDEDISAAFSSLTEEKEKGKPFSPSGDNAEEAIKIAERLGIK